MDRKGIELPFSEMFVGFVLLGGAVLIYLLLYAKIQDVHVVLREYEADIHAINLAQVLMSSNLAYSSPYYFVVQRGVFDKGKLDSGLIENLDIWYPDAIAVVGIEDLETGTKWTATLAPEKVGGTLTSDVMYCLTNRFNLQLSSIFGVTGAWEWPDIVKCSAEIDNQVVPAIREFSVDIRVSDSEIHSGRMLVSLRELIFNQIV